jgi:glutathione S-transferase
MLTVHHLGISQSERIVWLCEELELPYQLVRYDRVSPGGAPAGYKALHPYGTAPVITDGTVTLAESGAIVDYLTVKYGGGRLTVAPNSPDFADYLFWFHFANGSMVTNSMIQIVIATVPGADGNDVARGLGARSDRAFDLVETRLGTVPYFGGAEFSTADIMMFFPLTTMRAFAPRDLTPYPHLRAYLHRVGGRPAYRRAMAAADPSLVPMLE